VAVKDSSGGARILGRGQSNKKPRSVIRIGSKFYIHPSALTSRRAARVLVNGDSFAVFEVGAISWKDQTSRWASFIVIPGI
jgi:hypothetical protein